MPARLPHADNTAAANGNAGVANARQRIEPVLVHARRYDLAVEFRRGIEVVIIVIQARFFERFGKPPQYGGNDSLRFRISL